MMCIYHSFLSQKWHISLGIKIGIKNRYQPDNSRSCALTSYDVHLLGKVNRLLFKKRSFSIALLGSDKNVLFTGESV